MPPDSRRLAEGQMLDLRFAADSKCILDASLQPFQYLHQMGPIPLRRAYSPSTPCPRYREHQWPLPAAKPFTYEAGLGYNYGPLVIRRIRIIPGIKNRVAKRCFKPRCCLIRNVVDVRYFFTADGGSQLSIRCHSGCRYFD